MTEAAKAEAGGGSGAEASIRWDQEAVPSQYQCFHQPGHPQPCSGLVQGFNAGGLDPIM